MLINKKFWYESNSCWGWVTNLDELKEKAKLQIEENNGINNIDDFLDKSMQNVLGSMDFGTRSEHTGKKSLRTFLSEQEFDFSTIKIGGPKITYIKQDKSVDFDAFYCGDDHILYIKKASYNDIDLYYVIMEDAYRTPTADVMTSKEIEDRYGITSI